MKGLWNLKKLGISLSSLISEDEIKESLNKYWNKYEMYYMKEMRSKLGLVLEG